jgi:prephenate dehydratase
MIAAFQGVHGAYSHLACRQLLGDKVATLPCETFDEVFAAVEFGRAQRGVLPIENSLAGSIHQNYDLLVQHDLCIVGETHLRVRHCLLVHPTATRATLREVRSHPQALAQCNAFFARNTADKTRHPVKPMVWFDTAGAAKSLADEKPLHVGAIAGEFAAELYGLKVLDRNIANQEVNFTRFLAIAKKPVKIPAGIAAKTSLAYMPPRNEVGVLFKVLGVFALRGIDLCKIESRPNPSHPFEYRFYLDIMGDAATGPVQKALDHLRELGGDLRVLGSYASAAPEIVPKRSNTHKTKPTKDKK